MRGIRSSHRRKFGTLDDMRKWIWNTCFQFAENTPLGLCVNAISINLSIVQINDLKWIGGLYWTFYYCTQIAVMRLSEIHSVLSLTICFAFITKQRFLKATERHACFCFRNVISPQWDASRSRCNGRPTLHVISRVAWKSPREGGQRAQRLDVDNMRAVHQSHNRRSLTAYIGWWMK